MFNRYALSTLIVLGCAHGARSQAFTSSDICPVAGESFVQHYTPFQYPAGGGMSITEDYSALVTDSVVTVNYVSAASTPNAGAFPTADVASTTGGGNYSYYDITATAYSDVGWDIGGAAVSATDPEQWAVFPLDYGTTWTDDHSITWTTLGITTTRTGQLFGQADADDVTLILPSGTVTDVRRVFIHDTYEDNVGGFMTIDYDFTYHFYYKAGVHHPVLLVQNLYITPSVGSPTHTYFCVYADVASGVAEMRPVIGGLNVFPQPANEVAFITFTLDAASATSIELLDLTGQRVASAELGVLAVGTYQRSVDVKGLASGIYLLRLTASGSTLIRRIMVE